MTVQGLPPANWYPDPGAPGRERWWTGAEWSAASHRTPSPTWDWMPAYTRSFWAGLNTPARAARVTGMIAVLLVIPGAVLAALAPPLAVLIAVVMVVLALTTLGLGIAAISRAAREGGKGLAIWAMAVVPVVGIPCALIVAFLAIGLSSAS